ncbi:hypothetical protein BGX28_000731, partial [Mortierella sp. GBA30]
NPAHWRLLNIAKSTNADVLASPLRRLAQELEPEMAMRSRKAQAPRPSIFSVKPSSSLRSRSVHRKTSQNRLKTQFAPPADLLKTSSSSSSSMPITTTASHSHNSAMATHIMNRTCKGLGETTQFLQTTNPIYQPRSEKILSSTWFERAVVNPESIKAVDELQTQMEQQTARWIDRNGSLTSVEEDERTPAQISDRVWFVGSYAYAGIPLLEGCVVSAVQVMERIIASEPSLKLAASFNAPMESFLKQDEPMRERRRRRREALVGSEKQEQQHQQQGNGRSNHRSKPTPSSIYFQTAWKDALADDRKWEERQSSGVVGMSWLSNVYVEMAWMLVLYLLAIVEWWMVMAIESFEYYPNLIRLYRSIGVKIHDADNTLACFDVDFPSTSASVPSGLPSRDRTQRQTTAQVQEPYLSSRSYKVTSGHTITLPDLPPFSVLNPYPFGRRVLAYCRIAKDYVRMLMVSKEFMSKGRMMDIGKHPIEWGNGRRITLREFLEAGSYSHDFVTFFVPLFACVCTCSFERVMEYPACVVLEYVARCMPFGRMQFVSSGIHEVAEKLSRNVETIHYNTIVEHVFEADKTRHLTCQSEDDDEGVRPVVLVDSNGVQRSFDHVIFATQANQAAALLAGHKPKNEYRSSSPYGTSKENDSSSEDANYEYRDKRERAGPEIIPMDLGSGVLKTSQPFYHQIKTLLKIPYERTQV